MKMQRSHRTDQRTTHKRPFRTRVVREAAAEAPAVPLRILGTEPRRQPGFCLYSHC